MTKHSLWRATIVGLGITLGSACGGGGGGGGDSQSKAAFIEKADAICKATTDRAEGLLGQAAADPGGAVEQLLPALQAMVADIKAIPPPTDAQTSAIMAEFDKAVGQFQAVVAARQKGDAVTEQRVLNQLQAESDAFEKQAKDYGFKDCGQD